MVYSGSQPVGEAVGNGTPNWSLAYGAVGGDKKEDNILSRALRNRYVGVVTECRISVLNKGQPQKGELIFQGRLQICGKNALIIHRKIRDCDQVLVSGLGVCL